ncbi:MAG: NAD-dependent epimerase/dehydratase family protein [Myxococcales bacterium]|nr:NAD-dependent epimerase/dehydratase family protein [Myxococcales bacterium]
MPRVLIVGGSASLGPYLVDALAREMGSVDITIMDLRRYPGEGVDFVHGDVTRLDDCHRVLAGGPFDVVFTMVTPDLYQAPAEAFAEVNARGIKNLVAACREHEARALVHTSSIAVTDHFRDHVDVDERLPLPLPNEYRSPYDRSKRLGEETVLAADDPGGLRTCALRLGCVLAAMNDVTLRHTLRPVILLQDYGRPIDTIYAGNAAHGLALAGCAVLNRPDDVGGQAYFLTKGRAVTIHELYSLVGEHLSRPVVVLPSLARRALYRGLDAQHRLAVAFGRSVPGIPLCDFVRIQSFTQTFDNQKIAQDLGYQPRCTLEEGLARIIDEYLAAG